jgi:hypothetical protein
LPRGFVVVSRRPVHENRDTGARQKSVNQETVARSAPASVVTSQEADGEERRR